MNTLCTSVQLQRDKATLCNSHIAASCLLHSAAAAVRWDTMMAASWGSSTTYTWKITSRFHQHHYTGKHSGDGVALRKGWFNEEAKHPQYICVYLRTVYLLCDQGKQQIIIFVLFDNVSAASS